MSKSRDMILQSAKYLLSYRSLENITVKDICQWAGVATSTFFYHFKNKEALISCLHESDNTYHTADLLHIISCPDLLEQAIAACSIRAINSQRNGSILTAQYYKQRVESKELDADYHQYAAEQLKTATALIARAQQENIIKNTQPAEQLAHASINMVHGITIEWCASKTSFDLLQRCRELLLVIFNVQPA